MNTVKQYKRFVADKFVILCAFLADLKVSLGKIKVDVKTKVDFKDVIKKLQDVEGKLKQANEIGYTQVLQDNKRAGKLAKHLVAVQRQIAKIPQPKIVVPKPEKFPTQLSIKEGKDIVNEIKNLQSLLSRYEQKEVNLKPLSAGFVDLQKAIKGLNLEVNVPRAKPQTVDLKPVVKALKDMLKQLKDAPRIEFPSEINTHVLSQPARMIPQPVTNININPLRGLVHTSATTAGTILSTLPGYGVFENRRSLIFQNLASSTDVYIGGSNVTTVNGYLLEAGSVSPAFDSGPLQVWYVITSSGTADIRTIEIANDSGQ